MGLEALAAGGEGRTTDTFRGGASCDRLGQDDLRGNELAGDAARQTVDTGLGDPGNAPQKFFDPLRKHLGTADDDHVAAAARKLVTVAPPLHEIACAHFGRVAGELHEKFAVATGRKPGTARERLAQQVGRKPGLTIGHPKHLAELRGGVDLRDFCLRKHLLRLRQERPVGGLAAERDPVEHRLLQEASVGRGKQPPQERGRGREHGDGFVGDRAGDRVGVAGGGHDEPAAGEQGLEPDLNARPPRGVVDEQPPQAMPLLGEPRCGQERIPGMLDELGRATRAGRGHDHVRSDRFELAAVPGGWRRQLKRIADFHPVAKTPDQIAGVFGQEGDGHMLPATGRGDRDECIELLGPGHDADGTDRIERGFEGDDLRGERGIVDRGATRGAGADDDRRAARFLAGDFREGVGETVFDGCVGDGGDGGGGHEWPRA